VISPAFRPPEQPEFHPEFGYLWPAAHTRRMMRIGLFATAFGAMVGAIAAIGMTHRPDPDAQRAQTALAVETPPTVGAAPATTAAAAVTAVTPTITTAPNVAAVPPPRGTAAASCKEQTWPYLDGKCIKNSTRERQQVRVLKPETPVEPAPVEAAAAPTPETTAVVKPEEPLKASKKREKKTVGTRQRRRDRDREFADTDRSRTYSDRGRVDFERGRYVDDTRSAYAGPYERRYEPYERRYETRGGWGW
jgi:hypothetical protein